VKSESVFPNEDLEKKGRGSGVVKKVKRRPAVRARRGHDLRKKLFPITGGEKGVRAKTTEQRLTVEDSAALAAGLRIRKGEAF